MAATVTVRRLTGAAAATSTDVTAINTLFSWEDAHYAASPTYPIAIPAAGTNYGWWLSLRLSADTTPAVSISNVKFYTDGASGFFTNVALKAQNANVGADAGYRQATGTSGSGTNGTQLTTGNHTGLTGATVDAFTFTSGSPKSLTASISNPSTGVFGDYMVLQLEVPSTVTTTGNLTAETVTFSYDES